MKNTFLGLFLLMCVGSNVYGMDGGASGLDFEQYFDAKENQEGEDSVEAPAVPSSSSASSFSPSAAPIAPAASVLPDPVRAPAATPANITGTIPSSTGSAAAPTAAPAPAVTHPIASTASLTSPLVPTSKLAWYSNPYLKYGALFVVISGITYKVVRYYKDKNKKTKVENEFDYEDDGVGSAA